MVSVYHIFVKINMSSISIMPESPELLRFIQGFRLNYLEEVQVGLKSKFANDFTVFDSADDSFFFEL
jgi:hypothetical protein